MLVKRVAWSVRLGIASVFWMSDLCWIEHGRHNRNATARAILAGVEAIGPKRVGYQRGRAVAVWPLAVSLLDAVGDNVPRLSSIVVNADYVGVVFSSSSGGIDSATSSNA